MVLRFAELEVLLAEAGLAVPRSKAEIARITAVVAPTRDFTKAEAFEAKSAGAATVRARPTASLRIWDAR